MKRALKWTGLGSVGLLALGLAGGAAFQAISTRSALRKFKPPGRLVDVGDHRVHLHCTGDVDGPTVVLESGFGGWSIDWASVQPQIARFASVCSYDRSGLGWSERTAGSPTRSEIASRLRTLLHTAGAPGPYVLVGHSLGGLYVRQFARDFPDETAGMVFVDSSHEEMGGRASESDRKRARSRLRLLNYGRYLMPFGVQRLIKQPVANASTLRAIDQPAAYAIGYRTSSYFAVYDEIVGLLEEGFDEAMKLEPVPDVPIVVLASAENLDGERGAFWEELQKELAELSSDGRYEVAKDSGHFIQVDRPELVVAAVKDVLETSKRVT